MSRTIQESDSSLEQERATRRPSPLRRINPLGLLARVVRIIILLLFAFFFGIPLLWLLLAPSKGSNDELFNMPPISFGSFHNYAQAWGHLLQYNDGEILTWAGNSVIYAGSSLILAIAICMLAGYALGTANFRGRKLILYSTLIITGIPAIAFVLPLFLEINAVHLIDTAYAVILPSAFYPFGVYLSFIYFASSLPKDLLSSGRVDGCTELQLFWHVALPLARPLVGLLAFFNFVTNWNNFFLPSTVLTDDTKFNLPVGLGALLSSAPGIRPSLGTELPLFGPEIALAGLIVVLPIVIVFLFTQRLVVAGTLSGAEKE